MASQLNARGSETAKMTVMARRHREELCKLAEDGSSIDRSLIQHVGGAVVLDRRNQIGLGVAKISLRRRSLSYRTKEAVITEEDDGIDGAEWIAVHKDTTLPRCLKQYGSRLLGYDAKEDEFVIEVMAWELVDSTSKAVRILVRDA